MNDAPGWLAGAWYLVWMAALPALLLVENAAPRQRSHPRPWRRWSGNLALAAGAEKLSGEACHVADSQDRQFWNMGSVRAVR